MLKHNWILLSVGMQETYGEDPFLAGELVKGYVKGLQGDHPRYLRANAGCKHFDVHTGPENIPVSRFSFDAKVCDILFLLQIIFVVFWLYFERFYLCEEIMFHNYCLVVYV